MQDNLNKDIILKETNTKCMLNPYWVVGFTENGGSFSVSFNQNKNFKFGIEVRPSFSLDQKKDKKNVNTQIFREFIKFFKGGFVRHNKVSNSLKYETRNLSHLINEIIPFFLKTRIQTAKYFEFLKFVEICRIMSKGGHLNRQGLLEIIELAYTMNFVGNRKYTKEELLRIINKVKV